MIGSSKPSSAEQEAQVSFITFEPPPSTVIWYEVRGMFPVAITSITKTGVKTLKDQGMAALRPVNLHVDDSG